MPIRSTPAITFPARGARSRSRPASSSDHAADPCRPALAPGVADRPPAAAQCPLGRRQGQRRHAGAPGQEQPATAARQRGRPAHRGHGAGGTGAQPTFSHPHPAQPVGRRRVVHRCLFSPAARQAARRPCRHLPRHQRAPGAPGDARVPHGLLLLGGEPGAQRRAAAPALRHGHGPAAPAPAAWRIARNRGTDRQLPQPAAHVGRYMSLPPAPALSAVPPGIVNLADHESHARTHLDPRAWAYFSGGAADEITLAANRSAWERIRLLPRVLRPLAGGHTRVQLLGRTWAHPILLAPVAYQRMAHPDGELGSACAAAALGAGIVLSTQASTRLEVVAEAIRSDPGRGPLWFQLYLQHDRGFTRGLLERAEQAGYEALVLTVDAPCHGARDRERRAGFHLPCGVSAVNLHGLRPAPRVTLQADQSALFDGLLRHAPTWADVQWLQANTRLPVLLKGLMHPDDARQAAA